MRILHLTTFLQGGAGLALTSLAASQAGHGHDVTVMTSRTGVPGYDNYPAWLEALIDARVRVAQVDSLFDRRPDAHAPVERYLDVELGGAGAFDILHAHAAVPGALARAAVSRSGRRVPVLQTMHGWGVTKSASQSAHDVRVMNEVDRLVVPARTSATLLQSLGVAAHHMAVVPYGVAPAPPAAPADTHLQRMRGWRQHGDLVACCIGTVCERKNQVLLVEALARVAPDRRVHAVFVGDGPVDVLQERACALGVDDRVHTLGYQPDARRYLAESHLLVLPSRSEGQPLAVLEAFCDGVPVLASRLPELVELVEEGRTGWLFEPDDAGALAAALSRAAESPDSLLALADAARAIYRSRFTVEHMVAGYMHEYARAS
ncbi:MAG: glycosyltransferase family 4 protein [Vicinamibacterales bacterium]